MNNPTVQSPPLRPHLRDARGRAYTPALGPALKALLIVLFILTALLSVTGVYLGAIRFVEWQAAKTYTNQFTLWMVLAHIVGGLVFVAPFLIFGFTHWATAWKRKNRLAVRLGITLFIVGNLVVVSGLALIQLSGWLQLPTGSIGRILVYILHLATPVFAAILYIMHRRAGPDIKWSWGGGFGVVVVVFVAAMIVMHMQDPRQWYAQGSKDGEKYFEPSKTRTTDAKFIPAKALMMDAYCLKCHKDIYNDHIHSAHKFSSFSNPTYLFSVQETREAGRKRDGNVQGSRWCAGCHDQVPFLSGSFEDPRQDPHYDAGRDQDRVQQYEEVENVLNKRMDARNSAISSAGISCTVCHAMTNVNSTTGNGDYTIEEPTHYPFAYSDNSVLQWVNNQLVKAKPEFHKQTFLKPFHKTAEFCSTCHKVNLPVELNHYKEFLRGQNHYDTYLLSGVSGHGARSFYYPPEAKTNCAQCHMPLQPSADFGSKDFDGSGVRKGHGHWFPGGNTGLPSLLSLDPNHPDDAEAFRRQSQRQADFLRGVDPEGKDKKLRIDIFGLKPGGTVNGELIAPLRPKLPPLKPNSTYLIEVVVRTLALGHPFTQGTVDSNEVWVDFTASSGGKVIGRNGGLKDGNDAGELDPWAHRLNVLMLDRDGNRINRRNPQDIFTPLYNHQIPPGAGQVIHYQLTTPADLTAPVELSVKLRYRKFDFEYLSLVYGGADKVPKTPVVDLCEDKVVLPVEGGLAAPEQTSPIKPAWQRWNDYGIGCAIEGGIGLKKGEFRQAEEAYKHLLPLDPAEAKGARWNGHVNLARIYIDEGRWDEAVAALKAAKTDDPPAPWWLLAYHNGLVNLQNFRSKEGFDAAIADFEQILDPNNQPRERGFDFTKDYVVIDLLGGALFQRAQVETDPAALDAFLLRAVGQYEKTLLLDSEDLDAHYGLSQCFDQLGHSSPPGDFDLGDSKTDEATLQSLVNLLTDGAAEKKARLEAAARLEEAVIALGQQPADAKAPKRMRYEALVKQIEPFFHQKGDAETNAAASRALYVLHRELHAIFKPDDLAASQTAKVYREKHPAADKAANAVVIYELNRAGAPGLPEGGNR
ncbi:MAG TPA: hypothetical protein DDY78_27705 [Planctomycetales bacterium]|jgi:tetratricopeptide (TPR) repeat protein/mono/diheme cytochrome c family protein|nr:hypothetical protein [Planctomycetales bacterium]